ncbi:hypothetical protein [Cupriavidus campinensis]
MATTTDAPEACTGYLLVTSTEYVNMTALAQGLQIPAVEQIGAAFAAGFILPALCFIVARCVRSIFVWEKS